MNELIVQGRQEFLGKQIPIIKGGFGELEKCVLAKTVGEIHDTETKYINELINNNLDEFEIGIDLLDLMSSDFKVVATDLGFINSNRQKYCYLLSEQGYLALAGFMKTDKAKEVRKKFRRDYFLMKDKLEKINQSEITTTDNMNKFLGKMDNTLGDLKTYYRPSHLKKLNINKIIKTTLGTLASKKNCERVKEMLLLSLGKEIYDEVPIAVLHSTDTYEKIFSFCKLISNEGGEIQTDLFGGAN